MATQVTRRADRSAALEQYRRRAARYDQEVLPFEPLRAQAIAALRLAPGATVLDVGCGTGLSFELLRAGVGQSGHIVGIEQSPDMLARARERVRGCHWHNVELVCAPAARAPIHARGDAALFHLTHDIVRDEPSLAHVLKHLKPGARVVASGLRWAPAWMWPTNVFVMLAALYSVSSLEGLGQPWDKLAAHLDQLSVQSALMGGMFIATGRYHGPAPGC
jgi:SAM-dependent methyltransferase